MAELKEAFVDHMIQHFRESVNGGFYFTSADRESLISRNEDYFGNATPSGNSVAHTYENMSGRPPVTKLSEFESRQA